MKFTGQFQKKPAASSAPIPFSTGMFRSRPFPTPEAQRSPAATPDHEPLPRRNPDYNRMFGVQPKLTVGAPNDVYEQEADRVADQVMSMPDAAVQQPVQRETVPEEEEVQTKPLAASITPLVQREAMPEEEEVQTKAIDSIQREEMPQEEEDLQMKSIDSIQREEMPEEEEVQTKPALQRSTDGSLQAGGSIESRLHGSKSGGSPLPDDVRSFMEPRFGSDFSQVRVHTNSEAVQMNQDLNAQAFTYKQNVYFGAGKAPGKDALLTAHELTHVVQQTGTVQTKHNHEQPTVQMKCAACEKEDAEVQRSPTVSSSTSNAEVGLDQPTLTDQHGLASNRFKGDPTLEACYVDKTRLTKGAKGESVVKIQQALVDLGYDLGATGADGDYGSSTWNAVKQFKSDYNLGWENMGDVGPKTMQQLDLIFRDSGGQPGEIDPSPPPFSPPPSAPEGDADSCPIDGEVSDASQPVSESQLTFGNQRVEQEGISNQNEPSKLGNGSRSGNPIQDAIDRFKGQADVTDRPGEKDENKIIGKYGSNVSNRGQYFWASMLEGAIKNELNRIEAEAKKYTRLLDLAWVEYARDLIKEIWDHNSYTKPVFLGDLSQLALTTNSPEIPAMLALATGSNLSSGALESRLWTNLIASKVDSLPNLTSYTSIATFQNLRRFEDSACGLTAGMVATRLASKRSSGVKIPAFGASLFSGGGWRDRRPVGGSGKMLLGDLIYQTQVGQAVESMRRVLDAGGVVVARVLSGVGAGRQVMEPDVSAKPGPITDPVKSEHSILIIGHDTGNGFVFWDSGNHSSGADDSSNFGMLWYDSSDDRLSTASSYSELPVDENGERKGQKRYQIMSLISK